MFDQTIMTELPRRPAAPYALPFLLDRSAAPLYRLRNVSIERVDWVDLSLRGPGVMAVHRPRHLDPDQEIVFTLLADDPERRTSVQVSWKRPGDTTYLWVYSL